MKVNTVQEPKFFAVMGWNTAIITQINAYCFLLAA